MRRLPGGRFRWRLPVLALALVALPLAPARSSNLAPAVARFRAATARTPFTPAVAPLVVDGGRRVQVMVRVSGDSVAAVRALTPGRTLTAARHADVERTLRAGHDALVPQITAQGGRVVRHLYDAWNGMRVEIDRDQVASLRSLPGVVSVTPVRIHRLDNTRSVPFIGAPAAWAGAGAYTGGHVKVAVIDTGIDYTHADFGGTGTAAAYTAAHAASTSAADPAYFGPNAPKVKGGVDLVGDNYDADVSTSVPAPDPNPLDCNGHGSHVAGTIAGFGVNADGTTYVGSYDASTYAHSFEIGPGVAPEADLYAVRVFGCSGSTDVVTEAIDWAVQHDMQVINMSLGSPFGDPDSSDAQAADAAAKAGIVVVTSAGNSGPEPYLSGSPAAADGALAVAAVDSYTDYPGAELALDTGPTLAAIDANGLALPGGTLEVVVLRSGSAVSLGCDEAEYVDSVISGKVVVTLRGTCARADRATFGAKHGAAAVVMINTSTSYPPYEGPIADVDIPFLGLTSTDGDAMASASTVTLSAATVANPAARAVADFSSGGARYYDSALKPDVSAPGVSIFSTAVGTGFDGELLSGTSMAAPHVTGVAALTVQAHPTWSADQLRAAIENTAAPGQVADYSARLAGAGLVQPALSTATQVVVLARDGDESGIRRAALDFGFAEPRRDYRATRWLSVKNLGGATATFTVAAAATGGSPHRVQLSRSRLSVAAGAEARITVQLTVPATTAGDSTATREVAGLVTLTPASSSDNGGVTLRVPYYLVPRARAAVQAMPAVLSARRSREPLIVRNAGAAVAGTADFYHWGLSSPDDGLGAVDLRAVGVQSWDNGDGDRLIVFAISTWQRWSSAAAHEFDVLIDVDQDGTPDYAVSSLDHGEVTAGSYDGTVASFLIDLRTKKAVLEGLAVAPTDESTLLLPVYASDLGLSSSSPRFAYSAQSFDGITGAEDSIARYARFNAWAGVFSQPVEVAVPAGRTAIVPLTVRTGELARTRPLGLMVVEQENANGAEQAQLIPLR